MTEKEWRIPLDGASYLAVFVVRARGRVTQFAVVLINEGECVTRYDCAHDMPHRDVMGRKGALIRKEFCENMSRDEAFEYAISDLQKNRERYTGYFESH